MKAITLVNRHGGSVGDDVGARIAKALAAARIVAPVEVID